MRKLEGLKPEAVFYYFEEICKIPHGSGTRKLSANICRILRQSINWNVKAMKSEM